MADLEDDLDELLASIAGLTPEKPVEKRDSVIPDGLVAYVRSICRAEWVAQEVLDTAAKKVLRRLRHDIPEARRARWAKRWLPGNQAGTQRWLGQVRDHVLREHHLIHVSEHDVHARLPVTFLGWQANEAGTLVIDEPEDTNQSFGDSAYLEQTPVRLLRWVHEMWLQIQASAAGDRQKPRLWDLTSGSGTAADYFGRLHGCDIVSTDLVAPRAGANLADCRNVGLLREHGGRLGRGRPELVVAKPDIVLFDPSSPGLPPHSEIYGGKTDRKDLSLLYREHWIIAVADVAVRATKALAQGGFVSLLLRCGVRLDGQAIADEDVLEDFKTVLGHRATISHEMPLAFKTVRNQVSLGAARLPAVHLVLTRSK